jgi:hypothetical protein
MSREIERLKQRAYSCYQTYQHGATQGEREAGKNAFNRILTKLNLKSKIHFSEHDFQSGRWKGKQDTNSTSGKRPENWYTGYNADTGTGTGSYEYSNYKAWEEMFAGFYGFSNDEFRTGMHAEAARRKKERQAKQAKEQRAREFWKSNRECSNNQMNYIRLICETFSLPIPDRWLSRQEASNFLNKWAPVYENYSKFKKKFIDTMINGKWWYDI